MEVTEHDFKIRAVELYAMFGAPVETYEDLPDSFKDFVEMIGYQRVCILMVNRDLKRGRSIRTIMRRYRLTYAFVWKVKEMGVGRHPVLT